MPPPPPQAFLDRFVRQNIAEIDEIPAEDGLWLVQPGMGANHRELDEWWRWCVGGGLDSPTGHSCTALGPAHGGGAGDLPGAGPPPAGPRYAGQEDHQGEAEQRRGPGEAAEVWTNPPRTQNVLPPPQRSVTEGNAIWHYRNPVDHQ